MAGEEGKRPEPAAEPAAEATQASSEPARAPPPETSPPTSAPPPEPPEPIDAAPAETTPEAAAMTPAPPRLIKTEHEEVEPLPPIEPIDEPEVPPLPPPRPRMSPRTLAILGFFGGGVALGALFLPLAFDAIDPPKSVASAASAPSASASAIPDDAAAPVAIDDSGPAPPPVWRLAKLGSDPKIEIVEGTIGKRTLSQALASAGLAKGEAARIYDAFDGIKRLERAHVKDTFAFARERSSGHVVAFEYATSPFDVWQARGEPTGALEAKKLELYVQRARVAVGIAVEHDLRTSITKAGLDDDMLKILDDALEGHAELSDLRPGARLRLIASEDRVEGAFARYASLDAVEYFPPNPNAPSIRVYWYGQSPEHKKAAGGFYDAKGRQPYHGGWRSPVPFARVSSRFNPNRMHPVLHVVMPHTGVDFAATTGTPVYATAAGVVTSAGDSGACGNMVMVRHAGNLASGYCHLSRFAAGLHVGQHVEARQLIGYVGATGRVTGPHLHFIVKRGDNFIDPLSLRLDGVRVLPPSQRDDFAKRREELDAALDAIALPAANGAAPPSEDAGENEFYEEPP